MNPIGWNTFARVRAQLDAGLDRDVVLAAANLDAPTWMSEEEALLAALADDVERADFATMEAYRAAYGITWTELTGLALADTPQAIESSSRQFPPSASAEPVSPAEVQKASYQLVPEALVTSVPADHPIDRTVAAGLVLKDPLPFQPVPAPQAESRQETTPRRSNGEAPRLTLEQYASLCVEIAVFPRHVEAIFQRYGLVSQRWRLTLDLAWKERLRRNSTEYGEWHRLYQRYQAYWTDPARVDGLWHS